MRSFANHDSAGISAADCFLPFMLSRASALSGDGSWRPRGCFRVHTALELRFRGSHASGSESALTTTLSIAQELLCRTVCLEFASLSLQVPSRSLQQHVRGIAAFASCLRASARVTLLAYSQVAFCGGFAGLLLGTYCVTLPFWGQQGEPGPITGKQNLLVLPLFCACLLILCSSVSLLPYRSLGGEAETSFAARLDMRDHPYLISFSFNELSAASLPSVFARAPSRSLRHGASRAKILSQAWKEATQHNLEGLLALITTVR
jgi:hypothetical protein